MSISEMKVESRRAILEALQRLAARIDETLVDDGAIIKVLIEGGKRPRLLSRKRLPHLKKHEFINAIWLRKGAGPIQHAAYDSRGFLRLTIPDSTQPWAPREYRFELGQYKVVRSYRDGVTECTRHAAASIDSLVEAMLDVMTQRN